MLFGSDVFGGVRLADDGVVSFVGLPFVCEKNVVSLAVCAGGRVLPLLGMKNAPDAVDNFVTASVGVEQNNFNASCTLFHPVFPCHVADFALPALLAECIVENTSSENVALTLCLRLSGENSPMPVCAGYDADTGAFCVSVSQSAGEIAVSTDAADFTCMAAAEQSEDDFFAAASRANGVFSGQLSSANAVYIGMPVALTPHENKKIRMTVSWHAPCRKQPLKSYSLLYPDTRAIMQYALSHFDRLYDDTARFAEQLAGMSFSDADKAILRKGLFSTENPMFAEVLFPLLFADDAECRLTERTGDFAVNVLYEAYAYRLGRDCAAFLAKYYDALSYFYDTENTLPQDLRILVRQALRYFALRLHDNKTAKSLESAAHISASLPPVVSFLVGAPLCDLSHPLARLYAKAGVMYDSVACCLTLAPEERADGYAKYLFVLPNAVGYVVQEVDCVEAILCGGELAVNQVRVRHKPYVALLGGRKMHIKVDGNTVTFDNTVKIEVSRKLTVLADLSK